MKHSLTFTSMLLFGIASMAQTQVDISTLEFAETDNKSAIYAQYSAKVKLSATTNEGSQIKLDLGAGSAEVVQSDDDRLKAKAEIVLSVKNSNKITKELEDLELYIDDSGNTLELVSRFDYNEEKDQSSRFFSSPERKVNIKIYVPKGLDVQLKDRSGDLVITNVFNDFRISDGSGAIGIDGLEGNLDLRDNSGDIVIKNLNQNSNPDDLIVKINDSSGSIYLTDVNGKTEIDDNSGDIEIRNLGGELSIDDTSGGIFAKNIEGDSKVVDTSGEIELVSVDGNVTISDTSGGISIDTVSKDVTLKRDGSGSFDTKNVKGTITKRG